MSIKKQLSQVVGLAAVLLLLAACGASMAAPASTPVAQASTVTSAPEPADTPTVAAAESLEEWDYVAIGRYRMYGYAQNLAPQIESDLDVTVNVHEWHVTGLTSSSLVTRLRNNQLLRQLLSEAEVVTLEIPAPFLFPRTGREELYTALMDGTCGGPDNQDCLREALALYEEDVDAVFAELVALRSPSEAIIRGGDSWLPTGISEAWQEQGIYETLKPYWEAANAYTAEAAAEHQIPTARIHLAMNGPEGEEVPSEYVHPGEGGIFANEKGDAVIAAAYQELGFEPLAP
jgi:hypothetical protein